MFGFWREKQGEFGIERRRNAWGDQEARPDVINEVRTMSDITAEVFADDNMPCCTMPSVELLLDVSGDVLLDIEFFESGIGDLDRLLLKLFAHVHIFYDSFGT